MGPAEATTHDTRVPRSTPLITPCSATCCMLMPTLDPFLTSLLAASALRSSFQPTRLPSIIPRAEHKKLRVDHGLLDAITNTQLTAVTITVDWPAQFPSVSLPSFIWPSYPAARPLSRRNGPPPNHRLPNCPPVHLPLNLLRPRSLSSHSRPPLGF